MVPYPSPAKTASAKHAADHLSHWAVAALGPVPAHPLDRLDWQRRAASIGAWRNNHAYDERLRRIVDRANVA
jgi:hypothetical protein